MSFLWRFPTISVHVVDVMHPSREDLLGLVAGALDSARAVELIEHVDNCRDCEETIVALEADSDTRMDSLRREASPTPYETEAGCERAAALVERIESRKEARSSADDLPRNFGPYELQDVIGTGGMGVVYRANHRKLDKIVAVKTLSQDRLLDEESVARFEREMRAVGRLDHSHLVRAVDAGEVAGVHYLAMDFVAGRDLSWLADRLGPLPTAEACEVVRQAAVGLQEAHEQGLVHRDVKPGNLILAESRSGPPHVKVLDLGLASFTAAHSVAAHGLTGSGQPIGTIDYMAPEQAARNGPVDGRADVYALGATLYRLLVGDAVYPRAEYPTPVQKLTALATEPVPPIRSRRGDLSKRLAAVVHRMLERDPVDRYATPADVVEALAPFCEGPDLGRLLDDHLDLAEGAVERPITASNDATRTLARVLSGESLQQSSAARTKPLVRAEPAVAIPAPRHGPSWLWLALLMPLVVAGAVFYVQTAKGTLRVEIDDPGIEVRVKGTDITLTEAGQKDVTLRPGAKSLVVERDDFRFETDRIVLRRGDTVTVRVDLLPGRVRVEDNGRVIGSHDLAARDVHEPPLPTRLPPTGASPQPDPPPPEPVPLGEADRAFANWPDAPGLELTLDVDGEQRMLSYRHGRMAALPNEPFRVVGVVFHRHQGRAATEADFQRLLDSGIQHLETIGFMYQDPEVHWLEDLHRVMPDVKHFRFNGQAKYIPTLRKFEKLEFVQFTTPADAWVEMLSNKPTIRGLMIHNPVSTVGCEKLAAFPNLTNLVWYTTLDDARLRALSRSKSLTNLTVYSPVPNWNVTESGLSHFADFTSLKSISFGSTPLPQHLDPMALKSIVPHCRIEYAVDREMRVLPAEPRPR